MLTLIAGLASLAGAMLLDDAAIDAGLAALDAGAPAEAWSLMAPHLDEASPQAKHAAALILLGGDADADCAPQACRAKARRLLIESASEGWYLSLFALHDLMDRGAAGAPSLADIVRVEKTLARRGDPAMALRLAERYEAGDGVEASREKRFFWLQAAAEAKDPEFPHADRAAFLLCEAFARGDGVAASNRKATVWCQRSADLGHAGGAIALSRLARTAG